MAAENRMSKYVEHGKAFPDTHSKLHPAIQILLANQKAPTPSRKSHKHYLSLSNSRCENYYVQIYDSFHTTRGKMR